MYQQAASETLSTLGFVSKLRTGGPGTGCVVSATWSNPPEASNQGVTQRDTSSRLGNKDKFKLCVWGGVHKSSVIHGITRSQVLCAVICAPKSGPTGLSSCPLLVPLHSLLILMMRFLQIKLQHHCEPIPSRPHSIPPSQSLS